MGLVHPRLVLVHGFTQTGRSWGRLAEDLAGDHDVRTPDAPGHGAAANRPADLVDGAEQLAEVGGAGTWIGYSMGGRYCLHVALAHPELVHGLVLVGATGGIDAEQERAERRAADEALAIAIEEGGVAAFLDHWLAQPLLASLPSHAVDRADRLTNTARGLAASLRLAGTGTQAPLWERLDALAMPVLVVAGQHDDRFRTLGDRLVTAIGDNATMAVVPGAGHAAHLEQPDAFLTVLRRWLADNEL